jgi:hypothetical protein
MAFTTERNVDAQYPKENVCARRNRPASAGGFLAHARNASLLQSVVRRT